MKRWSIFLALGISVVLLPTLEAQTVAFELRAGGTLPIGAAIENGVEFGDAPGLAVAGGIGFTVSPSVSLLGGYSQHSFGCEPACTLRGSGLEAGVRLGVPSPLPLAPWLYAGALLHRLDLRTTAGAGEPNRFVASTSTGFQLGGGVSVPLRQGVALVPGARYVTYDVRLGEADDEGIPGASADLRVQYFVIDLGVRFQP